MTSKREEVAMSAASAMADFDSASGGEATMFQLAEVAQAVFEQAHTLRSATEKDRADLERLRETLAGSSPSEVRGEAVVNHRIGFWNISDPYDPEITAEMIALADEQLERYVQQRITEAHTPTDGELEALADWLRQGAPFDNETWGQYQDQLDFAASTIEAIRRPVQSTPTDDERAEAERVQKAAWAEIHGQDPQRTYSVAEVKRIVYSFDNVLSGLLARRPVQGEPEWEYACRDDRTGSVTSVGAPWMDHEYAERVTANEYPYMAGVRRRKAGPWLPVPDTTKEGNRPALGDNRDPECVKAWPGCHDFGYAPACCRFPKSCSAGGFEPVPDTDNTESEG